MMSPRLTAYWLYGIFNTKTGQLYAYRNTKKGAKKKARKINRRGKRTVVVARVYLTAIPESLFP